MLTDGANRPRGAKPREGTEMNQLVLWSEGHWRCELHATTSERGLLKIFQGGEQIILEPVFVGESAFKRARFCVASSVVTPRRH